MLRYEQSYYLSHFDVSERSVYSHSLWCVLKSICAVYVGKTPNTINIQAGAQKSFFFFFVNKIYEPCIELKMLLDQNWPWSVFYQVLGIYKLCIVIQPWLWRSPLPWVVDISKQTWNFTVACLDHTDNNGNNLSPAVIVRRVKRCLRDACSVSILGRMLHLQLICVFVFID